MQKEKTHNRREAQVHVLGCKVNQAESGAMVGILETQGYTVSTAGNAPDLIIVNTCCVTSKAEGKSRRTVKRLAERHPNATLIVTGCLAEVNPSSLGNLSGNCVVLGTYEKDHFGRFIQTLPDFATPVIRRGANRAKSFGDLHSAPMPGRARAFLKIQDGCSQRCSYCIVPTARGPSRSLAPEAVLEHAAAMEAAGYAEIVLTGVHLGAYGHDLSPRLTFEKLLAKLLEVCTFVRFRLSSIEPQEITAGLIDVAASHPRVCRHFHIPLQSADDDILTRMRRPYSAALVTDLLERIFRADPDTCVGLDVLVGFPGEHEESFRKTRAFVQESGATYLHVFPFSPRPGTPAATFTSRVPSAVTQQRVEELRSISRTLRTKFYTRFVGKTLAAVIEPGSNPDARFVVARTDTYLPVRILASTVRADQTQVTVRIEAVRGELISGTVSGG